MVTLRVYRFDPDSGEEGHFDTYDVPYEEGMRVLDGLHYIHDHLDGTLAFRWVCRAGQCGSCGIRINGKAGLACQEPLQGEGETMLEPLMLFPVVKDLVVDFGEGYRRLYESEPYLSREEPMADPPALLPGDVAPLKDFRSCIECWCCVSACPVANRVWDDYYGPIVMRKLCELDIDSRDLAERVKIALNEGLYHCTTCRNCWAVCPEHIEIPEKAVEKLRAHAVRDGLGPLPGHNTLVQSIKNYRNPWVMPRQRRARWAKGLELSDRGAFMFFAGCSPSLLLGDRLPANVVRVLDRLGMRPAYLGKEELCCGSPLLKVGDEVAYRELASENIALMKERGVKTLVTTCAGCHKSWATDYRAFFGDFGIEVKHVSEVLWDAFQSGAFTLRDLPENHVTVTYHDPCHLGRGTGVYDAPRNLIRAVPGMRLVEPERIRENSHCCGSGGGVKTAKPEVALEVGKERIRQFEELEPAYIISCCPWCEQHLDDSIAYARASLGATRDLIEIIERTMEVASHERGNC